MLSFDSLNLPEVLKTALAEMNFETPTPIQSKAIPEALAGRDLIGCAQTGTGKTAAFSIPLLVSLLKSDDTNALILVPTRELAEQVEAVLHQLTAHCRRLKPVLIIGGANLHSQIRRLAQSPRILVATPGRLLDHMRQGHVSLQKTGVLVLDEADRMLDMGFAPQLNQILRHLPKERQTLMFSATVPPNIRDLAGRFLVKPVQISVSRPSEAAPKIKQESMQVPQAKKDDTLLDVLNARTGSLLVFARTQSRTNRLFRYLESYGVKVERIHGGRTQAQRRRALQDFRDGNVRVLLATDIAARGIDIDHVAHVVNYDLPMDPEDYVHRIGRTGRAGRSGEALSFLTPEDRKTWIAIQRLVNPGAPLEKLPAAPAKRRHEAGKSKIASRGKPHPGSKSQQRAGSNKAKRSATSASASAKPARKDGPRRAFGATSKPAQRKGPKSGFRSRDMYA